MSYFVFNLFIFPQNSFVIYILKQQHITKIAAKPPLTVKRHIWNLEPQNKNFFSIVYCTEHLNKEVTMADWIDWRSSCEIHTSMNQLASYMECVSYGRHCKGNRPIVRSTISSVESVLWFLITRAINYLNRWL